MKCVHASQIAGSGEGRKTRPQFEMKGQIESLLAKKTPAENSCKTGCRQETAGPTNVFFDP